MTDWDDLIGKTLGEENKTNEFVDIEKELLNKYHFKTVKDTEEIYYYNSEKGIFVKNGEQIIKREYVEYFPDCKITRVDETVFHLRFKTLIERDEFDYNIEWLAAKDCMINLKTGETKPHSPDFMATVKIPHNYNIQLSPLPTRESYVFESLSLSACPCPKIMRFLYEVMSPEDVETFLDFAAYCLWRDYPFHKWLLFNGSGRNGKGVTTNLLIRLLGQDNVSTESLQRVLDRPFSAAQLYGKLANIDADLSKDSLGNTGLLKKMTGNDILTVEKKFKNPFQFKNHAKFSFSANESPITTDESDAFFSRLIIINFPKQFLGDKADPHLIDKLSTKMEMSGLFYLVASRVAKVLDNGISGANQSLDDNYIKYILSSDPIRAFYEKCIEKFPNNNEPKERVYSEFCDFCV